MAMTPRESAVVALMNSVANAYAWKLGPSRNSSFGATCLRRARPACFLFEGGQETYSWTESAIPKRIVEVRLFIYLNAKDPSIAGSTLLNSVMDALDTTFALSGGDIANGRNTLGGTVYNCRIEGKTSKDPGDLDGDALLIVPVKLTLP